MAAGSLTAVPCPDWCGTTEAAGGRFQDWSEHLEKTLLKNKKPLARHLKALLQHLTGKEKKEHIQRKQST